MFQNQAHRIEDEQTVDQYILGEFRRPKVWLGAFVVTLFAFLFIVTLLLGSPLPA